MGKTVKIWITVCVCFLCLLGLVMTFVFRAYQFSGLCAFALAGLILVYVFLHLLKKNKPVLSRVLCIFLSVCLILGGIAAAVTGGFIIRTAVAQPQPGCQYLIVLGCGVNGTVPSMSLRERINGAYAYLMENPGTICVVSGGQGPGEDITEAECMFRELTAMGIAPERIWLEDKSTSTQENLTFSLDVIESKTGSRPTTAAITSSEYHLFRAGLMAQDLGLTSVPVPSTTQRFTLRINYFLREIAAVWFYLIFS